MGELHRSIPFDVPVAATTTVTETVGTAEQAVLVIFWTLTNTSAVTDLATYEIRAVDPDGNIMPDVLTPEAISARTKVGPVTSAVERYDVRGISQVELTLENGNAAARDAKVFVNHYWE